MKRRKIIAAGLAAGLLWSSNFFTMEAAMVNSTNNRQAVKGYKQQGVSSWGNLPRTLPATMMTFSLGKSGRKMTCSPFMTAAS